MQEIVSYPAFGQVLQGDYIPEIPKAYQTHAQVLPENQQVFDIRDFGARPEAGLLNTEAIARACEACRDAGGGIVLVEGGTYVTGTVRLYDHTTLFVQAGSTLIASRNAEDLVFHEADTQDMGDESSGGALIFARDAVDLCLTGGGRISGAGEWFVYPPRKPPVFEPEPVTLLPRRDQAHEINTVPGSIRTAYRDRIRYAEDKYGEGRVPIRRPSAMVHLHQCKGIRVENIELHDSMCWTLHLDGCKQIVIRDLVIHDNRHVANTDGIDLTGCSHVKVEHCFISCADDGICLKNPVHTGRGMEDITIRDCYVCTVMNAFKIGTGTRYDIRDVLVEDCVFAMPDLYPGSVSGISIESCDGSYVENVTVRRIQMQRIQCPLYVVINRRNQANVPYSEDPQSVYWGGEIRNIRIEEIQAVDAELPAILTGYVDKTRSGAMIRKPIENIVVRDYEVTYREGAESIQLPDAYDEFLTDYPECNAHGDVDAYGIWVRHAEDVCLENIRVTPRSMNKRPQIRMRDV